jgi:tetratricopeptide (TPR) repeat protein
MRRRVRLRKNCGARVCYNCPRMKRFSYWFSCALLASTMAAAFCSSAAGAPTHSFGSHPPVFTIAETGRLGPQGESERNPVQAGIYLVFPFDSVGASPRLDWLGEGLEELTIERLAGSGQQVYSHEGRSEEMERSGLPANAKLSRASMLRIAQNLDADFVILGRFASDGKTLTVESQVLQVTPPRLLPAVREAGPLESLMDLHQRMLWRLLSANGHAYTGSLEEFARAQRPLRLDAFEHYVRGLLATEDDVKLRELREAARLEPDWPDPDFAIGDAYYARRDCDSALLWFPKIPKTHERYAEALFSTGVCRLILNQPEKAGDVFAALQGELRNSMISGADLPEILNNLALAEARQGKTQEAIGQLRRAAELDPDEDDYPFNLGLLAFGAGEYGSAADYFRDAAGREPDKPENRAMMILALEKAGKKAEADQERDAAAENFGPDGLPTIKLDAKGDSLTKLERLRTELDTTALQLELASGAGQAASEEPASAVFANNPTAHVRRGRQELSAGRVDAAESEFRAALAADNNNASAHNGLAEVFRRRGKLDDTVKELQASLAIRDSAGVRTTLARVYLEQKKPELAKTELEQALKLAPKYSDAKVLLDHLQKGKPSGGTP